MSGLSRQYEQTPAAQFRPKPFYNFANTLLTKMIASLVPLYDEGIYIRNDTRDTYEIGEGKQ